MTSQTWCQSIAAWGVARIVQHAKSMDTSSSFACWLTTFLDEKAVNLDVCFDVEGPSGMINVISYGVVVEHMLATTEEEQCEAHVRAAGYPVPRKSACVFCPYGSKGDWQVLSRELPNAFAQAVALEADKPPTSAGKKLSIMGYRTIKKDGVELGYKAPPLPLFIQGTYKPKRIPCGVCGRADRASKAAGCGYLP